MKEKEFCVECRDFIDYTVEDRKMTITLKGKEYTYNGKVAICGQCGIGFYPDEINDYNLDALYSEYRRVNNLKKECPFYEE